MVYGSVMCMCMQKRNDVVHGILVTVNYVLVCCCDWKTKRKQGKSVKDKCRVGELELIKVTCGNLRAVEKQ